MVPGRQLRVGSRHRSPVVAAVGSKQPRADHPSMPCGSATGAHHPPGGHLVARCLKPSQNCHCLNRKGPGRAGAWFTWHPRLRVWRGPLSAPFASGRHVIRRFPRLRFPRFRRRRSFDSSVGPQDPLQRRGSWPSRKRPRGCSR